MTIDVQHPRCPFCHAAVAPTQAKVACDACMSWHHDPCWGEHGRCAACGRAKALSTAAIAAPSPGRTPAAGASRGEHAIGVGHRAQSSGAPRREHAVEGFRVLCAHAVVEGRLGEGAHAVLMRAAVALGLDVVTHGRILADVMTRPSAASLKAPATHAERQALVQLVVDAVAADGLVQAAEQVLFRRLASSLELDPLEVESLLRAAAERARTRARRTS